MPHRARWLSALLLALMFHGQSLAASLTPFLLPGIADSVIALADGSLMFNNTYGPTFSRLNPVTGEIIEITIGAAQTRNQGLMGILDRYGVQSLSGELVVLGVVSLGAMWLDQVRSRRDSASAGRQTAAPTDADPISRNQLE